MGITSIQKIKIISSLGLVITAGIGLIFAVPHLIKEEEKQPDPIPEIPPVPPLVPEEPKKENVPVVPEVQPVKNNEESVSVKLNNLKNKKTELTKNVSDYISKTNSSLKSISNKSALERQLKACQEQIKQQVLDIENEKVDLTNKYEVLKGDVGTATEIQKKINGDLKNLESDADKNNEDAERYKKFEDKYTEVENEFKNLKDKKSDEEFGKSLQALSKKMGQAYNTCSIKDLVQINDFLGANSDRIEEK